MRFSVIFNKQNERPVKFVPRSVLAFLVLFLAVQVVMNARLPGQAVTATEMPEVPRLQMLELAALGDTTALGKFLMLWLQAFDNQPGISIPFRQLDYTHVRDWLERILQLDPRSQYPLLSASRVYASVNDNERKRIMLEFVNRKFNEDPLRRWPWMAHAVYIAKHQLGDLEYALTLAKQIRDSVPPGSAPAWARQMEIYILEEMDEIESAMVLIGGLLESGQITDENELRYLKYKLEQLKENNKPQATGN